MANVILRLHCVIVGGATWLGSPPRWKSVDFLPYRILKLLLHISPEAPEEGAEKKRTHV